MNSVAGIFKIPVLVTEQNPKSFGNSMSEVAETFPKNLHKIFEKDTFSMINEDTRKFLDDYKERKTAIIYGLETQVCVFQTALDLLESGYEVHLIADGISSIQYMDRSIGLKRLE